MRYRTLYLQLLALVSSIFLLSSCADMSKSIASLNASLDGLGMNITPTKPEMDFDLQYDLVWGKIMGYIAQTGATIGTAQKENGVIQVDIGDFPDFLAHCPPRVKPLSWRRESRMTVNVLKVSAIKTHVAVYPQFVQLNTNGSPECRTTGELERQIFAAIVK